MSTKSPWQSVKMPEFPALKRDLQCNVLVIGGGLTGMTAAYLLQRAGKKVCLIERDQLGGGDTKSTTAHLTYVTDLRLTKLVKNFGKEGAKRAWLGGAAAINTIEQIVATEQIACQFRRVPAYLHAALDGAGDETDDLRQESELARELGFEATFLESVPEVDKPGIQFANQAKFHPLRYLSAIAKAFVDQGGEIYEQTEATEFSEGPRTVVANGKKIICDYIVIATHVPLLGETGTTRGALFQAKLASYTSYVIGARIPKDQIQEASFWDTADPYYYLRIDEGDSLDYAILGGQDHKTGQATDGAARFENLESHLKGLIPQAEINYRWSGQVVETDDGLPYIGETATGQFAATGFSGNGMTFGTLAAMMACDAATGRKNPWHDLFAINRKSLKSTWEVIAENIDYPYYLVKDLVTRSPAKSTDEIQRGEAAVLKVNGKQAACYRDTQGTLQCVSAICTHLGCVVNWNAVERSWDCPCHGSRFDSSGAVLAGPAETALKEIEPKRS